MTRDYMGREEVEAERKEKRPRRGGPPTKICPQCYMIHNLSQRVCINCGWVFYPKKEPA